MKKFTSEIRKAKIDWKVDKSGAKKDLIFLISLNLEIESCPQKW